MDEFGRIGYHLRSQPFREATVYPLKGSTARDVLYKSTVPVLICPSKGQIYDRVFFKARHVNIRERKVGYDQ